VDSDANPVDSVDSDANPVDSVRLASSEPSQRVSEKNQKRPKQWSFSSRLGLFNNLIFGAPNLGFIVTVHRHRASQRSCAPSRLTSSSRRRWSRSSSCLPLLASPGTPLTDRVICRASHRLRRCCCSPRSVTSLQPSCVNQWNSGGCGSSLFLFVNFSRSPLFLVRGFQFILQFKVMIFLYFI